MQFWRQRRSHPANGQFLVRGALLVSFGETRPRPRSAGRRLKDRGPRILDQKANNLDGLAISTPATSTMVISQKYFKQGRSPQCHLDPSVWSVPVPSRVCFRITIQWDLPTRSSGSMRVPVGYRTILVPGRAGGHAESPWAWHTVCTPCGKPNIESAAFGPCCQT